MNVGGQGRSHTDRRGKRIVLTRAVLFYFPSFSSPPPTTPASCGGGTVRARVDCQRECIPFINLCRLFGGGGGGELNFSKLTAYKTAFGRETIPHGERRWRRRRGHVGRVNLSTVRSPGINNVINRRSVYKSPRGGGVKSVTGGRPGEKKVFNFVRRGEKSHFLPSSIRILPQRLSFCSLYIVIRLPPPPPSSRTIRRSERFGGGGDNTRENPRGNSYARQTHMQTCI